MAALLWFLTGVRSTMNQFWPSFKRLLWKICKIKPFLGRSLKEKLTLNWTLTLNTDGSSLPQKKNQPKKLKSLFWATFRVLCPPEYFPSPILILRENLIFSYLEMVCLGFKIAYMRHTLSLLYTSKEFDQKTW